LYAEVRKTFRATPATTRNAAESMMPKEEIGSREESFKGCIGIG
jgi:hypothetical protein